MRRRAHLLCQSGICWLVGLLIALLPNLPARDAMIPRLAALEFALLMALPILGLGWLLAILFAERIIANPKRWCAAFLIATGLYLAEEGFGDTAWIAVWIGAVISGVALAAWLTIRPPALRREAPTTI
ncbi:hypothetical protein [Sphingomonas sp.]|uniref:hypothetical protein n=1 Tax=Sphingomonas sp. TaxID=28214 RepID=UPI000DB34BC2|nr:hypothetical protein [Sphingomonas sp.]PZU11908.1 MAG: hypothetical protein DI605_02875 [Sphingomonas sp.]